MATMNLSTTSVWKVSFQYGLLAFLGYAIIFFICRLLGVADNTELRALNFLLLGFVSFLAIKSYKSATHNEMNYFEGLSIGFLTSVISFGVFGLFLWGYLALFDNQLLTEITNNSPEGMYPSHFHSGVMMISEGVGAGVIIGFILMMYFKRNRH